MRVKNPELWSIRYLSHCHVKMNPDKYAYHRAFPPPSSCCDGCGNPRHLLKPSLMLLRDMEPVQNKSSRNRSWNNDQQQIIRTFATMKEARLFAAKYKIERCGFALDAGTSDVENGYVNNDVSAKLAPSLKRRSVHSKQRIRHGEFCIDLDDAGNVRYYCISASQTWCKVTSLAHLFIVQIAVKRGRLLAVDRDANTHLFGQNWEIEKQTVLRK